MTPAWAQEVLVVRSSDAEPHRQASAAACQRLREESFTARELDLASFSDGNLVAASADGYLAVGSAAATWLNERIGEDAPLVFCLVMETDATDLLRRAKTCGLSAEVALDHQLTIISETLPKARAIGVLHRADSPRSTMRLAALRAALPAGWKLNAIAVDQHRAFADATEAMLDQKPDVVWMSMDPSVYDPASIRSLLLAAMRRRTPVFGFSIPVVRAGALVGVGIDPSEHGREAATLLARLRRTASSTADAMASKRPPAPFRIAVNLAVAENIGVPLPQSLLERCDYRYRNE